MRKILTKFLLPLLTCVFGVIIGITIKNFSLFSIDYKLKITDVIGNLATIGIGIFVPIIVKKLIEDLKSVKSVVLIEVDGYKQALKSAFDVFEQCHNNGKITKAHNDIISYSLGLADSQFEKMKTVLIGQFSDKLDSEIADLYSCQNDLWKIMTGHDVTKSSVTKIPSEIYASAKNINQRFDVKVITLKNKIHII